MSILTTLILWFILTVIMSFIAIRLIVVGIRGVANTRLITYTKGIKKINYILFKRYVELIDAELNKEGADRDSLFEIKDLCLLAIEHIKDLPMDKQSRWIGYVQRSLRDLNVISIDSERDFTRPMFHSVYEKHNMSTKVRQAYKHQE